MRSIHGGVRGPGGWWRGLIAEKSVYAELNMPLRLKINNFEVLIYLKK